MEPYAFLDFFHYTLRMKGCASSLSGGLVPFDQSDSTSTQILMTPPDAIPVWTWCTLGLKNSARCAFGSHRA